MVDELAMGASTKTNADEVRELMDINAKLQRRLDEATKNLAIKQAEEQEVRKRLGEAKAEQAAGEEKLRKMGYKLEDDEAVRMVDHKAVLDAFAQDMKISWGDFEEEVADFDFRFQLRLMSALYRLAADDDPNLVARLKAYKEYRNARAKDITVCKMADLEQVKRNLNRGSGQQVLR